MGDKMFECYIPFRCCVVLNRFSCVGLIATLSTVAYGLLCPWDSPGKSTRVDLPFPTPGDLPDTVLNLCLLCLLY